MVRKVFRFGKRYFPPLFSPLGVYSLSEFPVYRRRGIIGRCIDRIPAPLKALCAVTGMAAATVLIAPAVLIIFGPPLICGAWWVRNQRKSLQNLANQLHDQRWRDMASYHLQSSETPDPNGKFNQENSQRMPSFVKFTVENAIERNEQGIATRLGIQPKYKPHIEFQELKALSQDFRMSTVGFNEQMTIAEYPLSVSGETKAIIRVVSRKNTDKSESKSRIELLLDDNSLVILKTSNSGDNVIEGHGMRIE